MPTLRPARSEDIDAVLDAFLTARAVCLPYLPLLHAADDSREFFRGVLGSAEALVSLDREDGVAAFIVWRAGWVEHLYVHPDRHGAGHGSGILSDVQRRHPEGLQLWLFQRNATARRFYERRGFRPVRFGDGSTNEERTPDLLERWDGGDAPVP